MWKAAQGLDSETNAFGLSIQEDVLERLFAFTGVRKTVTTRQIVTVSKGKSVTVGGRRIIADVARKKKGRNKVQ